MRIRGEFRFPGYQKTVTRQGSMAETCRLWGSTLLVEDFSVLGSVGMGAFKVSKLAVPGVSLLIIFLAYSSQVLFFYIEPKPPSNRELAQFNLLVLCVWICYLRACITSPGRVPQEWSPAKAMAQRVDDGVAHSEHTRQRWCRKCEAFKPPRAHHCKTCGRLVVNHCIDGQFADLPKMYTKDGPSLSLDEQLCITFHVSTFHTLLVLRCSSNILSGIFPLHSLCSPLGQARSTKRE